MEDTELWRKCVRQSDRPDDDIGSTVCLTPMLFPKVLNAKQGNGMYRSSSLWYGSTEYKTSTYRIKSEHSITGK